MFTRQNRKLTDDEIYLKRTEAAEHALAFMIDAIEEHLAFGTNSSYLLRALALGRSVLARARS